MNSVSNINAHRPDRNGAARNTVTTGPWGIAEFSEIFEVTPRTLRHYEDKGLISPSRESGSRIFTQQDYGRVERILRAKRLGFSLDDIREVFEVADGQVKDRAELLRRKGNFKKVIKSLERRHLDIKSTALEMTAMCADIEKFIAATPETPHAAGKAHSAPDVFVHAAAYEAAFAETLSADDFGGGLSAPVRASTHASGAKKLQPKFITD